MNNPQIRVSGAHRVSIDPINSIAELTVIAGKFARIVDAEPAATVCKLSTAVGDLSASVLNGSDTTDEFAEEVAGVMVAAAVAAHNYGVTAEQLCEALRRNIAHDASKAITEHMNAALTQRGMSSML